jgi:hypothetical protein
VRLGQPNTCGFAGIPVGPEAVRVLWPGKSVSPGFVSGTRTSISSSGSLVRSLPVPPSEGLAPGVKIRATVRWSSTVVVVSALRR